MSQALQSLADLEAEVGNAPAAERLYGEALALRHGIGADLTFLEADELAYTVSPANGPQVEFLNLADLQPLCDAGDARGGTWADDDSIVFQPVASGSGLLRVSSAGGMPVPLTKLATGEATHRWPQVLPGGKAVIYTAHSSVNAFDDASIVVGHRSWLVRQASWNAAGAVPNTVGSPPTSFRATKRL